MLEKSALVDFEKRFDSNFALLADPVDPHILNLSNLVRQDLIADTHIPVGTSPCGKAEMLEHWISLESG